MKNLVNKSIITLISIVAIIISGIQSVEAKCHEDDFKALKAFYESTNGDTWANNTGWEIIKDNDVPPENCNLYNLKGVTFYRGRVVGLSFSGPSNKITGELPSEIYLLEKLRNLSISSNALSGCIPQTIGFLENLSTLNLKNNKLSGDIPVTIGFLKNLTHLTLGDNELSGKIPNEIANCTNLIRVELYNNNLNGEIPSQIGNLKKMGILDVSRNNLTGNIPAQIGNCENLAYFRLNNNSITNSIPPEIGNLHELRRLQIMKNQLNGEIPTEIGQLSKLEHFDASSNNITGGIPEELGKCEKLNECMLNDNQLNGAIPGTIGDIYKLRKFYVNNNNLEGCYPYNLRKICLTLNKLANTNERVSEGNNFNESWENFDQYFMGVCDESSRMSNNQSEAITIYPNPSNGFINVSYTNENINTNTPTELSIYNATGSEVFSQSINNQPTNNININVSQLTKGSYIVKINKATEIYYEKLMIN